jgi:hypothetical protein
MPIKKLLFLSILSSSSLFALWDFGGGMGYRRDQIGFDFSLSDQTIYKERNNDLNGLPFELYLQYESRWLLFSLRGDVGWYLSGHAANDPLVGIPHLPSYQSSFTESVHGFFSDFEGLFGVRLDFDREFWGALQGSMGVFYQELKRGVPSPSQHLIDGVVSITYDLSQTRLDRLWWGPGAGAALAYQPQSAWVFEAEYFYYFLYLNQHFEPLAYITYLGANPSAFIIRTDSQADLTGQGQFFRGKMAAQVSKSCWMNLVFDLLYFNADKKEGSLKKSFQELFPTAATFSLTESVQGKAWWHSFSILLEIETIF